MQLVHSEGEVQAEQFKGQDEHNPFNKYLPVGHVRQDYVVDKLQVKQLYYV
jgi:hypothetical protein